MTIPQDKIVDNILRNEDGSVSFSYRYYSPSYWKKMMDKAENRREKNLVRSTWKRVEGGRWVKAIDAVHLMVYKLDPDERKSFFSSNPRLKTWLNIHGRITGKTTF